MMTPTLADDVYCLIIEELVRQSDVSAVMRSSRSLYSLSVNRLLRLGVSIHSDEELISFCHFMTRNFLDMRTKTNQLRELTLSIHWQGDDYDSDVDEPEEYEYVERMQGPSLLVPVLSCITNLQRLTIEYCETLLRSDDRLVDAFAALTTVRELHITGFGLLVYDLVANLSSKLFKAHVDCGYHVLKDAIKHYEGWGMVDPLHMLRRHQDSLEDATIHLADVTAWLLELERQGAPYVFTRVHTLALSRCHIIERRAIRDAFPNLRALEVFWMEAENLSENRGELLSIDAVRSMNIIDPKQWMLLDYLYADVDSLVMLALRRPIGRIDIVLWSFIGEQIARMWTAIGDTRPHRLVLRWGYFHDGEMIPILHPARLAYLFSGLDVTVRQEITHLGMDAALKTLRGEPLKCMEAFAYTLASLPRVRFFSLRLHAVAPEDEHEYEDTTPAGDVYNVLEAFRYRNVVTWACWLAPRIRSLELICVFMMGCRLFFRITRQGGVLVQVLTPEDGERLMATEGMQWHCASKMLWDW